jgi:hydrogenase/urease accessory protein HupE
MRKYLDDILLLAGAGLILAATAALNLVAALYVAGVFCIIAGVLVGAGQKESSNGK